jgi:hypothetical protein
VHPFNTKPGGLDRIENSWASQLCEWLKIEVWLHVKNTLLVVAERNQQ